MFSIPFIVILILLGVSFFTLTCSIAMFLDQNSSPGYILITLLIFSGFLFISIGSGLYRDVETVKYYDIVNINYTEGISKQVYIKDGVPNDLESDTIYDPNVYHIKVETYKTDKWGISWAKTDNVYIAKRVEEIKK